MRDDGSTPSKFYNQEGNIVMADNQSGDFDISVENHEGLKEDWHHLMINIIFLSLTKALQVILGVKN